MAVNAFITTLTFKLACALSTTVRPQQNTMWEFEQFFMSRGLVNEYSTKESSCSCSGHLIPRNAFYLKVHCYTLQIFLDSPSFLLLLIFCQPW